MTDTIYDTIITNIEADPRAWCTGSYQQVLADDSGTARVSACLVGHVDLALRTCYIEDPVGPGSDPGAYSSPIFVVSDDAAQWERRHQIVAHLAELADVGIVEPREISPVGFRMKMFGEDDYYPAAQSHGEAELTEWNDDDYNRTREDVIDLVREASLTYPND